MNDNKKKVVIVDDHPLFRERLSQLIDYQPDIEVTGEAESTKDAIQVIQNTSPDLAIIQGTDEVLVAIRRVLAGEIFLSEKMTSRLLKNLTTTEVEGTSGPVDRLTDRECSARFHSGVATCEDVVLSVKRLPKLFVSRFLTTDRAFRRSSNGAFLKGFSGYQGPKNLMGSDLGWRSLRKSSFRAVGASGFIAGRARGLSFISSFP